MARFQQLASVELVDGEVINTNVLTRHGANGPFSSPSDAIWSSENASTNAVHATADLVAAHAVSFVATGGGVGLVDEISLALQRLDMVKITDEYRMYVEIKILLLL